MAGRHRVGRDTLREDMRSQKGYNGAEAEWELGWQWCSVGDIESIQNGHCPTHPLGLFLLGVHHSLHVICGRS